MALTSSTSIPNRSMYRVIRKHTYQLEESEEELTVAPEEDLFQIQVDLNQSLIRVSLHHKLYM